MIANLPPGLLMIVGAALIPCLSRRAQSSAVLLLCLASFGLFLLLPEGENWRFTWLGVELTLVRIDTLSRIFGIVFHLAVILSSIYALHVRDTRQHTSALVYAGAAIGACCAKDLLTLFVYWELTAISSVFLVWASDSERSFRSGMRYLIIQVSSGVLLLSGAIVHLLQSGNVQFESFVVAGQPLSLAGMLILLAVGIKCAFPLLHNWLQDAYPEATPTGTVVLSAFTTKLAVYALIRGFSGYDLLVPIGCIMTLFPIVFAVIENDLRRVLAYSLNNQLGFMVVGVGIGTELAINGAVAHAFCHIIYKSLLFMSMGAVLYRVGTTKATELGGLHKSMPWTTIFCLIGAGAISGFPLLSGFVSKSMILTAAAEEHHFLVWIVLLIASAGVMEHSGIKIPFFAFFAHDSGKRVPEAPWNMLTAMAIAALFCIGLGVAYPLLYRMLPFEVDYHPFTVTHVVTQLQLLTFALLAFVALVKSGLYPDEVRSTNLDTDWFYRRLAPAVVNGLRMTYRTVNDTFRSDVITIVDGAMKQTKATFNDKGLFGGTWSTSVMTFLATVLLAVCLILYYL
ncbi:MAG: Na(+)/H(+) antiporter subunit D [Pirellulaceae bacterium]